MLIQRIDRCGTTANLIYAFALGITCCFEKFCTIKSILVTDIVSGDTDSLLAVRSPPKVTLQTKYKECTAV